MEAQRRLRSDGSIAYTQFSCLVFHVWVLEAATEFKWDWLAGLPGSTKLCSLSFHSKLKEFFSGLDSLWMCAKCISGHMLSALYSFWTSEYSVAD